MYKLFFLQVIFPYFVKNKNKNKKIKKRVKSPKRKIKGLRKNNIPQKKNMNKTWNCASINATTLIFADDYCRVSINAIVCDELNNLILTCHISISNVVDNEKRIVIQFNHDNSVVR